MLRPQMTANIEGSPRNIESRAIGKALKGSKHSLMIRKLKKNYPDVNDFKNDFRSTNYTT
jgi:hypothetical protein